MTHSPSARAAATAVLAFLSLGACTGDPAEELERPGTGATSAALTPADTARTASADGGAQVSVSSDTSPAWRDSSRVVAAPAPDTARAPVVAPAPSRAVRRPEPVRTRAAATDSGRRAPVAARAAAASPASAPATSVAAASTPAPAETRPAAPATRPVPAPAQAPSAAGAPRHPLPFSAGERLEYDVRYGPFRVGRAVLALTSVERLRDRPVFHASFTLRGGNRLISVNDSYESWFDTLTLASLRYVQDIDQGPYERDRHWDIFPERQTLQERGKQEEPSVPLPLDDASFIYFVRTLPLEPGTTYEFNRYFRPDRNPVKVVVLRRERVRVPAGTFDAVVVRPVIKSKGIFGESGQAEVWFADDSTRRVLQIKSQLGVGTVSMHLR